MKITRAEAMKLPRNMRRFISKQNGMKVPGIQANVNVKKEFSKKESNTINKIIDEKNPIQK